MNTIILNLNEPSPSTLYNLWLACGQSIAESNSNIEITDLVTIRVMLAKWYKVLTGEPVQSHIM